MCKFPDNPNSIPLSWWPSFLVLKDSWWQAFLCLESSLFLWFRTSASMQRWICCWWYPSAPPPWKRIACRWLAVSAWILQVALCWQMGLISVILAFGSFLKFWAFAWVQKFLPIVFEKWSIAFHFQEKVSQSVRCLMLFPSKVSQIVLFLLLFP